MNRRVLSLSLCMVLFCLAFGSPALAQKITASLRGKVADTNGLVLPNAKITARQIDTNFTKSVSSGSLGQYYLDGLPAGQYQVQVETPGFAKIVQKVELTVGLEAGL